MNTATVTIKDGRLRGEETEAAYIFRGIPYAKAPKGLRRFKAPEPCEPWQGTRDATAFSPICPQADPRSGFYGKEFYTDPKYPLPKMDEDCLYLNVWAPVNPNPAGCPVAVWFHGGAFDHGWSYEMEFDGKRFAENGVVLVTVNYRVGVFGFFAHPQLKRETPRHTEGNYGILDQIEALKWVQRNIAAFRGDPDRVTIFGQSAGAVSVETLLYSPLARGLFSQAVMQSGPSLGKGFAGTHEPKEAEEISRDVMKLCGADSVSQMRNIPAEKFVEILPELYKKHPGLAFGPVTDGCVLKRGFDHPEDAADVTIMAGVNGDDIGMEKGRDIRGSSLYQSFCAFADAMSTKNTHPVYAYVFNHKLPGDDAGAFHSSELWYVFGTAERCWRPMDRTDYILMTMLNDAWSDFFQKGNPGWHSYQKDAPFIRIFR